MKLTKLTNIVVIGLALTVAVAGCRKRPSDLTRIPAGKTPKPSDEDISKPLRPEMPQSIPVPQGVGGPGPIGDKSPAFQLPDFAQREKWARDAKVFEAYTVHFDFDSSALKTSERPKIAAVADYLKANPKHALEIDGHCDERGTEEYNRALGERRALALREEVIRLGISPELIDTVTYGKDRPKNPGHNEEAWRENRRGEFLLEVPPK
jgi:peptidoglycan-associated lipoprotein